MRLQTSTKKGGQTGGAQPQNNGSITSALSKAQWEGTARIGFRGFSCLCTVCESTKTMPQNMKTA